MSSDIEIEFREELFNPVYMPYFSDNSRFLILYGGAGSGKSVFAAQKILLRTLTESNHRFLIIRKTFNSHRNSTFKLFKDIVYQHSDYNWGLGNFFKFTDTNLNIKCPNNSEILFAGADDVEKLKSIQGITGTWTEEATELTEADANQINLRLRGNTTYYKQHIYTFNPIDEYHWIRHKFFPNISNATTQRKDGVTFLKTTYLDNKFIDEEYKNQLKSYEQLDETYYRIYALGEWASFKGLVYNNWEVTDSYFPDNVDIVYGVDFGYNNPTAIAKVAFINDHTVMIDELLYQTHLTNNDLINKIKDLAITNQVIYADSAEPDRIEEIRRAGIIVKPAEKDIRLGIDFVKRFKILLTKRSENAIKEFKNYKYKEDKLGNIIEEPVKINNHFVDAVRYAIYTHAPYIGISKVAFPQIKKAKKDKYDGY